VKEWWEAVTLNNNGTTRKSLASLIMLVSWEIWNERNSRVFRHFSSMPTIVVVRIKSEMSLWSAAGAKLLARSCRESSFFSSTPGGLFLLAASLCKTLP
jgi:hypothetical protein